MRTRHYEQFWTRYEAGQWEGHTKALVDEILNPGDLFVDIGAWIGPVSLWALEREANVIAVEPDPMALPELRRRVPPSVEIWEGAVDISPGTATLKGAGRGDRGFGLSMSRIDKSGNIQVRTWTLPEILAGRKPALVKVDVEGYEITLLPKIAPYLAKMGVPLQVALHGVLPELDWFADYGTLRMPKNPHGTLAARP